MHEASPIFHILKKKDIFISMNMYTFFDLTNVNHLKVSFDNVTRRKIYHELPNVLLNLVPNHPWQLKLCMIILVNIL